MADVTMPLAELDELRNTIKTLENEKQELISKQKQVHVLHKYFNGKIVPGDTSGIRVQLTGFSLSSNAWQSSWQRSYQNFDREYNLEDVLRRDLLRITLTEDKTRSSSEFINLSEAQGIIAEVEQKKIQTQLDTALARATNAEYELTVIKDRHKKELLSTQESYSTTIEELKNKHETSIKESQSQYNNLLEEYENFKVNKAKISLETKMQDLEIQLHNLKKRSLWERILNRQEELT